MTGNDEYLGPYKAALANHHDDVERLAPHLGACHERDDPAEEDQLCEAPPAPAARARWLCFSGRGGDLRAAAAHRDHYSSRRVAGHRHRHTFAAFKAGAGRDKAIRPTRVPRPARPRRENGPACPGGAGGGGCRPSPTRSIREPRAGYNELLKRRGARRRWPPRRVPQTPPRRAREPPRYRDRWRNA